MASNKNTTLIKREVFVNEIVFYNRDNISLLGFMQQGKAFTETEYIISRHHLKTLLNTNEKQGLEIQRRIADLFATPHAVPATINLIDLFGTTQVLQANELLLSRPAEDIEGLVHIQGVNTSSRKFFF